MSAEAEFHRKRRMFAIVDGVLHIAPEGSTRSHGEWMTEAGLLPRPFMSVAWQAAFEKIVRGYYLDGDLVAYRGQDFEIMGCYQAVHPLLAQFAEAFGFDPAATKLWLGARPGKVGDVWVGRSYAGTIQENMDMGS